MLQMFSVGEHRIIYRAANWTAGLSVTAYLWSPSLVQSGLQTLTEIAEGLYYLDFNFDAVGAWPAIFMEDGVKAGFATMRVTALDGAAASDIWGHTPRTLTQTAAEVQAALEGSRIAIHRGDDLSVSLTGLGSLASRTHLWFTVKRDKSDVDTAAIIQITEGEGLTRLNGAEGTVANGSLTVDDEDAGNITIVLKAVETAKLRRANLHYDVQVLIGGVISTRTESRCNIAMDVTRATSG